MGRGFPITTAQTQQTYAAGARGGGVAAIVGALLRAARRDLASFESLKVNNFFLFVALLIYGALVSGVEPRSAYPFLLLLGLVLLFPLSADPLDRIPPHRLASWPLAGRQRLALRLASLALSPILWITATILLFAAPALAGFFLLMAVAIQALIVASSHLVERVPGWNPKRHIPPFPGRLGGVVRNHLREMLSLLDPYLALVFAISGTSYRFLAAAPEADAFPILALLVGLALSTCAQCLFGLESASGVSRYRLLPLRGWEVLLAKDIAFLAMLAVMVAPLALGPGLTFGLVALAVGHFPSVGMVRQQRRWRFTSGRLIYGAMQVVVGFGLSSAEWQQGSWYLVGAAVLWLTSLYWNGNRFERASIR